MSGHDHDHDTIGPNGQCSVCWCRWLAAATRGEPVEVEVAADVAFEHPVRMTVITGVCRDGEEEG